MNKKICLVTGAAGFIGSHLAKRLKEEYKEVRLVDDFSRGRQRYLNYLGIDAPCIKMDLREYNGYNKGYFENVNDVYHTACRIGNNEYLHGSAEKKLRALQDNLAIDRNVFKICKEQNIKKIIYTSSVSVYNTKKQTKNDALFSEEDVEHQKLDPEAGYGWAKYIGERQLKWLSEMGIKVGVLRIFKSYGPCDDYSNESGQVVCSLMRKIINYPKEDFTIWNDGTSKRCLVYIDDLIDAIIKVKDYIDKESKTFNIGGNEPYSINYLARQILELSNKDIEINYDMSKLAGVKSRIPILERAKKELDWEPTTPLKEGLEKTYEWMKYDIANS